MKFLERYGELVLGAMLIMVTGMGLAALGRRFASNPERLGRNLLLPSVLVALGGFSRPETVWVALLACTTGVAGFHLLNPPPTPAKEENIASQQPLISNDEFQAMLEFIRRDGEDQARERRESQAATTSESSED